MISRERHRHYHPPPKSIETLLQYPQPLGIALWNRARPDTAAPYAQPLTQPPPYPTPVPSSFSSYPCNPPPPLLLPGQQTMPALVSCVPYRLGWQSSPASPRGMQVVDVWLLLLAIARLHSVVLAVLLDQEVSLTEILDHAGGDEGSGVGSRGGPHLMASLPSSHDLTRRGSTPSGWRLGVRA